MILPVEVVRRTLPTLLSQEDERLFSAEIEKTLPSVETEIVSGEFFPAGWQGDAQGWKGRLKTLVMVITTKKRAFPPHGGRTPLIATDRLSNGYFHWVTETLPRLWWLKDQLAGLELLLPSFAAKMPYMVQSLALFPDLKVRAIGAKIRWRLDEALLVPATAPTGNYRPWLLKVVGEAWRLKVLPKTPFRKIYISRSKAARRRIVNEAEVRSVLEAQGFETVHLEGMAFEDQVRLLAEATHLVSNHGAGLTNMLFMTPGSRVTEVRMRGDTHNNCYFSLARALDLDYSYRLGDPARYGGSAHTADLWVEPKGLI